jgi:hypothetical protein
VAKGFEHEILIVRKREAGSSHVVQKFKVRT